MNASAYSPYELLDSAIDWITATHANGALGQEQCINHERWLDEERAAGRKVSSGRRFGYEGHSIIGGFFGRRPADVLTVLSGPRCTPLARQTLTTATNVSRIDIQSTVFCNGEEPHVGLDIYRHVLAHRKSGRGVGGVTIINTWPRGECCYINRRTSDSYFRIYDKATEGNLGPPRTVWRYEGEFKRKTASSIAAAALEADLSPSWMNNFLVRSLVSKDVPCSCLPAPNAISCEVSVPSRSGNTRAWLRSTVRECVCRQIKEHGLPAILEDLGLKNLVKAVN